MSFDSSYRHWLKAIPTYRHTSVSFSVQVLNVGVSRNFVGWLTCLADWSCPFRMVRFRNAACLPCVTRRRSCIKQPHSGVTDKPQAQEEIIKSCHISFFVSGAMKLTVGMPTPRLNRKIMKGFATKRTAVGQQRLTSGERMLIVYLWSIDTVSVRYWCVWLS
jgi:hypothetical protein